MSLVYAPEWAQNWAYQCAYGREEVESEPISRITLGGCLPDPPSATSE